MRLKGLELFYSSGYSRSTSSIDSRSFSSFSPICKPKQSFRSILFVGERRNGFLCYIMQLKKLSSILLLLILVGPITSLKASNHNSLIWAGKLGHINEAKKLVKNGADVNKGDEIGMTALMSACRYNYIDIAELLLENGADVNKGDEIGNTALIWAIFSHNVEIVQLLLEQDGIQVNKQDNYGYTPLIYACMWDQDKIVKLLLVDKRTKLLKSINFKKNLDKNKVLKYCLDNKGFLEQKAIENFNNKLNTLVEGYVNKNLEYSKNYPLSLIWLIVPFIF